MAVVYDYGIATNVERKRRARLCNFLVDCDFCIRPWLSAFGSKTSCENMGATIINTNHAAMGVQRLVSVQTIVVITDNKNLKNDSSNFKAFHLLIVKNKILTTNPIQFYL